MWERILALSGDVIRVDLQVGETIYCELSDNGIGRDPSLRFGTCLAPARRFVQPLDRSGLHRGFFCSAVHESQYVESLTRAGYEVETGAL